MTTTVDAPGRTRAQSSASPYFMPAFWGLLWRTAGLQFVAFFVIASAIYGYQPQVGASTDDLVAFYSGDRTRILIAAIFYGFGILNLLWFAAALRTTLADAGQDGWGAAITAASAVFAGLSLMLMAIGAGLAYSVAGSGNHALLTGLNDFSWALGVLTAFPRAMLIMSAAFGLWRAGLISNVLFAAGVTLVVLGVLGGTTWLDHGLWSPDGAFARFVSPALLLTWMTVVSWVVLARSPATRSGW